MENEQIKTAQKFLMDEKLRENTNLWVEKKNSRRQAKGKLSHEVQILSQCLTLITILSD